MKKTNSLLEVNLNLDAFDEKYNDIKELSQAFSTINVYDNQCTGRCQGNHYAEKPLVDDWCNEVEYCECTCDEEKLFEIKGTLSALIGKYNDLKLTEVLKEPLMEIVKAKYYSRLNGAIENNYKATDVFRITEEGLDDEFCE